MRILFPILLVGAAIATFFGYTSPHYPQVMAQKVELDKIELAKKNAYSLAKQRDKVLKQRNSISPDDVAKLTKMLPDGVENVGLIIEINNLAKRDNMGEISNPQINSTGGGTGASATKGLDSSKYSAISMSFTVSGTYDQFLTFLRHLETYVRIVDVVGLSFTSNKEGKYDYAFTIQTYWLK